MSHTTNTEQCSRFVRTAMPEGLIVAECPITNENREADARLFAAAPDLLAALEQMVSHYETLDDGDGSIQQARTALAKAKGEV